jgi:2Fe-2S ferredoxin
MLDFVSSPKKESRLSCQVMMSNELDGLIVKLPERQG